MLLESLTIPLRSSCNKLNFCEFGNQKKKKKKKTVMFWNSCKVHKITDISIMENKNKNKKQ